MESLNSHSNPTVPASYKNSICHLLDTYCVSGTTFDALIPTYSHLSMNQKLKKSKQVTHSHTEEEPRSESKNV